MLDRLPEVDQGRLDEVPVQGHLDEVAAALIEPTLHSRNFPQKFVHLFERKSPNSLRNFFEMTQAMEGANLGSFGFRFTFSLPIGILDPTYCTPNFKAKLLSTIYR